jgi:hypothetical protein
MMKRVRGNNNGNSKKKEAIDVVSIHERDVEGQLYLLKDGRPVLPEQYVLALKEKGIKVRDGK